MEEIEKKDESQLTMERNAEELERQIVRFTNIDKESFTHAFRGISITVAKGASQIMRLPEADHMATHLARKILSRIKKGSMTREEKERGGNLWNENEVFELKSRILSDIGIDGNNTRMTEEDKHKSDLDDLESRFGGKKEDKEDENEKGSGSKTVTKADIIKELEKRGVKKIDVSKSKEDLLSQLMELEQKGN